MSETSFIVLGLLERLEPATPYDLKQIAQLSTVNFWNVSHTQIYTECARLAHAGLLSEQHEQTGRRRRIYRLTATGKKEAGTGWRATLPDEPYQLRNRRPCGCSSVPSRVRLAEHGGCGPHQTSGRGYEALRERVAGAAPRAGGWRWSWGSPRDASSSASGRTCWSASARPGGWGRRRVTEEVLGGRAQEGQRAGPVIGADESARGPRSGRPARPSPWPGPDRRLRRPRRRSPARSPAGAAPARGHRFVRASHPAAANPASPIATSVWPWRHARPTLSVIITAGPVPGAGAEKLAQARTYALGGGAGSRGQQDERAGGPVRLRHFSEAFNAGVGAHTKPWRVRLMSTCGRVRAANSARTCSARTGRARGSLSLSVVLFLRCEARGRASSANHVLDLPMCVLSALETVASAIATSRRCRGAARRGAAPRSATRGRLKVGCWDAAQRPCGQAGESRPALRRGRGRGACSCSRRCGAAAL